MEDYTDVSVPSYANAHGLHIKKGPGCYNILQFADGTCQVTVGQVETSWVFQSGKCIPVTFEVLENCCADVVLGDSLLYDHNVFEDHASSIIEFHSDSDQLAPFDLVKKWQRQWSSFKDRLNPKSAKGTDLIPISHTRRSLRFNR